MSLFNLANGVKLWVSFGNRELGVRHGQIYQCEAYPDEADLVLVEVNPPPSRKGKPHLIRHANVAVRSGCFVQCENVLPYQLEVRKTDKKGRAQVSVYCIPVQAKGDVLKQLWPFKETPPLLSEWKFDIHQCAWFPVADYMVVREVERNFLVSPFYLESGGTVLDWHSGDSAGSKPPKG